MPARTTTTTTTTRHERTDGRRGMGGVVVGEGVLQPLRACWVGVLGRCAGPVWASVGFCGASGGLLVLVGDGW